MNENLLTADFTHNSIFRHYEYTDINKLLFLRISMLGGIHCTGLSDVGIYDSILKQGQCT